MYLLFSLFCFDVISFVCCFYFLSIVLILFLWFDVAFFGFCFNVISLVCCYFSFFCFVLVLFLLFDVALLSPAFVLILFLLFVVSCDLLFD